MTYRTGDGQYSLFSIYRIYALDFLFVVTLQLDEEFFKVVQLEQIL